MQCGPSPDAAADDDRRAAATVRPNLDAAVRPGKSSAYSRVVRILRSDAIMASDSVMPLSWVPPGTVRRTLSCSKPPKDASRDSLGASCNCGSPERPATACEPSRPPDESLMQALPEGPDRGQTRDWARSEETASVERAAMSEGHDANAADRSRASDAMYLYRFGTAEFDETRSTLRVDGDPVDLEQRPLQVLTLLLQHPDEVVTREELFESVWAGRPTVDNVLANAVDKLRRALGAGNAARIVTLPRVGYRLSGPIERTAASRRLLSRLELGTGAPVPGRVHFVLESQLGPSLSNEVWLARHEKTGERRVYKFSADGERLGSLKREATIYRLLRESLGERKDFVRLIDWNFEEPPFYLECEYAGPNLAEWAVDESGLTRLSRAERIGLLLRIADAVAAAHSVGVLHKDLKPANVLIGRDIAYAAPAVRIADFGSGRLLEPGRLEALGITAMGLTLTQAAASDTSGTLLYIAPEVLAGKVPTVQSDVYALGLMLYQIVVGDLRRPLLPGWENDIDDELLREDIAAAADGDPARRLRSVHALCERLRRRGARLQRRLTLRDAETRAQAAERLLLRSRARRPWVLAAGALLVAGMAATLWQFHRAQLARDDARQQAAIAAAVNRFMTDDLIGAADPSVSGRKDLTVIEAARAAIPAIDKMLGAPSAPLRAALHLAMQKTLSELSDTKEAVAEGRRAMAAFGTPGVSDSLGLAEATIWLAYDLSRLGRYQEASRLLDGVERDVPHLAERKPDLQIKLYQARSIVSADQMDLRSAYGYDKKAWALVQALPNVSPSLRDSLQFDIADSQSMLGELAASEATLRDLIARQTTRLGRGHQQTLYSTVLLARTLFLEERLDEAEKLVAAAVPGLSEALGPKARRTLIAKSVMADVEMRHRKYREAAALYAQIHESAVEHYGERNQATIAFLGDLAVATHYGGDARGAEAIFRRALASSRSLFDEDHPQVQNLRFHLADCLLSQKRDPLEAAALLAGLDPAKLNMTERTTDWPARLAYEQGRIFLRTGRAKEALELFRDAQKLVAAGGDEDPALPREALRSELALAQEAVRTD